MDKLAAITCTQPTGVSIGIMRVGSRPSPLRIRCVLVLRGREHFEIGEGLGANVT